jgi:hypothetical protein
MGLAIDITSLKYTREAEMSHPLAQICTGDTGSLISRQGVTQMGRPKLAKNKKEQKYVERAAEFNQPGTQ